MDRKTMLALLNQVDEIDQAKAVSMAEEARDAIFNTSNALYATEAAMDALDSIRDADKPTDVTTGDLSAWKRAYEHMVALLSDATRYSGQESLDAANGALDYLRKSEQM